MHELNKHDRAMLNRREMLFVSINGLIGVCATPPLIAQLAPVSEFKVLTELIQDNDYPFFGGTLPEGY